MFGRSKVPEGAEILEHWFSLVSNHHIPVGEFYDSLMENIVSKKLPGLDSERVELAEGGPISDNREYLRFSRERLRFDVCLAPVGVDSFFSYRFYALPARVEPWQVLAILILFGIAVQLVGKVIGFVLGPAILFAVLVFLVWIARNAIGLGLRDLDSALLKSPLIGTIYDRYLRRDTFYRQDMRMAYGVVVSATVKTVAEQFMGKEGVDLVRSFESSPMLADFETTERQLSES